MMMWFWLFFMRVTMRTIVTIVKQRFGQDDHFDVIGLRGIIKDSIGSGQLKFESSTGKGFLYIAAFL